MASTAPGLGLGVHFKCFHRLFDVLMEMPFTWTKMPCPFRGAASISVVFKTNSGTSTTWLLGPVSAEHDMLPGEMPTRKATVQWFTGVFRRPVADLHSNVAPQRSISVPSSRMLFSSSICADKAWNQKVITSSKLKSKVHSLYLLVPVQLFVLSKCI